MPDSNWYSTLASLLPSLKVQAGIAVFKTFIGGWTTSHHMHEGSRLECIFGCKGCSDTLEHYLLCAPLWLIAAEAGGFSLPLALENRLCMRSITRQSIVTLAIVFHTYQYTKAHLPAKPGGGTVQPLSLIHI